MGTKTADTTGLYDMNGSVWEWRRDWFDDIGTGTANNPTGPSLTSSKQ
ncbi:MAG: SUMF1/EgtB/PvdO family nonheme iron enzyme [Treponema sp.]|nr:SUMF1/EgtB/PvdO family nonheme iron enzyme [Treponema sp.]